jgi:Tol biopolymer transport system component
VALLAPAGALGTFPGRNGVIAYTAEREIYRVTEVVTRRLAESTTEIESTGESDILAMDPNTGGEIQLTSGHHDSDPSFSPSGNVLAFQRREAGVLTIYVARADGEQVRPITWGSEPAFSPDGREIVLVRPGGLYVTGLTRGARVRRITDHPGDRDPRWGSSGSIAFERTDTWRAKEHRGNDRVDDDLNARNELDILTPPSLRVRPVVTYSLDTNMWPEWSPNGRALAAALCAGREGETFEGTGIPQRVPGHPPLLPSVVFHLSCTPAVWAPDGRGLTELGVLDARTLPNGSTCPGPTPENGEILWQPIDDPPSWQPLVDGTQPVPTLLKCPSVPKYEPYAATILRGTRACIYSRRRHRRICFLA